MVLCMRLMEQQNHQSNGSLRMGHSQFQWSRIFYPKYSLIIFPLELKLLFGSVNPPIFRRAGVRNDRPCLRFPLDFESMACVGKPKALYSNHETQWNTSRSEWEKRRFTVACPEKIKKMISVCWHCVEERPSEHFLMPSIFRFGWWGKNGISVGTG